jgi:integrase
MFATGARVGEAVRLQWRDVSLAQGLVTITMGKLNDERREAHMPPELVAALANIPGDRDGSVFFYASYESMKDPWHGAIRRAGIERLTPHCCRHGFATGLLHQGVDIVTVAELGGWKSPEQLFRTYGHAKKDRTLVNLLTGKLQSQTNADTVQVIGRKAQKA